MICELTASKLRNKIQGELRLINASECSLLPLRFYSLLLELCSQFVFPFDLLRSARVRRRRYRNEAGIHGRRAGGVRWRWNGAVRRLGGELA